jgi:hypothetical protein
VQGSSTAAPDRLTVAGAFGGHVAALATAAAAGSTTLQLKSGQGARFAAGRNGVLFVGRTETVRVVSCSGDTLTVTADPAQSGHGLYYAHAAGSPVEPVQVVTYSCATGTPFGPEPYLLRDDGSRTGTNAWQNMVACGIEDLQLVQRPYGLQLQVTGRCLEPDADYTHQARRDHYHRMTLTTEVAPRNSAALRLREY